MKKNLWAIAAVVIAIGLSAFTKAPEKTKKPLTGEIWFVFNGVDPADLIIASKYSIDDDGTSPTVCTSSMDTYRCEIHAVPQTGNSSLPDLSTINDVKKRHTP